MGSNQRTTLLTGGTGFIGQYVLKGLLKAGQRVVVMLRGPQAHSIARLVKNLRLLGVSIEDYLNEDRLLIVEGVLPHQLPLRNWGGTDEILHCAACLQLDNDQSNDQSGAESGEPFTTNFEGVKALADWADAHHVKDVHFVSTAYVCGRDATCAAECFHQPRPRFETDYELSKWLAEEYLLDWSRRTGPSLTIFRPSLVVGDSTTGFTTQFGGFYQLARMIDLLQQSFGGRRDGQVLHLPMRLPGKPESPQNLVPVDYVASAIVEIVTRLNLHGRIYHLTNPSPPTNQEVKSWLEEYYHVEGGHFVRRLDRSTSESLAEGMFLHMNDLIIRQMSFVPHFDCTNTLKALEGTPVTPPQLQRDMVFRMLDYASSQQWGGRAKAAAS